MKKSDIFLVTLKPAKMVKSEAERSLGLVPSPHRPKGTNVKLDNSHWVALTVPPPGFPHIDREKAECSIFLLRNTSLWSIYLAIAIHKPQVVTQKVVPTHTGLCVLFNAKMGMTFWIITRALKLSHDGVPLGRGRWVQVGDRVEGGECISQVLCAFN